MSNNEADVIRDKERFERGYNAALEVAAEAVYAAMGGQGEPPLWSDALAMVRALAADSKVGNPEPEIGGRVSRLEHQFGHLLNRLEAVEVEVTGRMVAGATNAGGAQ